ncbi:unnamed protein product [Rhodiola kirilowii]
MLNSESCSRFPVATEAGMHSYDIPALTNRGSLYWWSGFCYFAVPQDMMLIAIRMF